MILFIHSNHRRLRNRGIIIFYNNGCFIFFSTVFYNVECNIYNYLESKKRKGKTPKKRYIVIPIIFLIISLLVELIPIGWVGVVRLGNKSNSADTIIAESGKTIYYGDSLNGDVAGTIEMDGTTYTYLNIVSSGSSDTWNLGKPVANIRFKADEKGFREILNSLFAYNVTDTLYPVINENGFKLYTTDSNIDIGRTIDIYCPEDQNDLILAEYKELNHVN